MNKNLQKTNYKLNRKIFNKIRNNLKIFRILFQKKLDLIFHNLILIIKILKKLIYYLKIKQLKTSFYKKIEL